MRTWHRIVVTFRFWGFLHSNYWRRGCLWCCWKDALYTSPSPLCVGKKAKNWRAILWSDLAGSFQDTDLSIHQNSRDRCLDNLRKSCKERETDRVIERNKGKKIFTRVSLAWTPAVGRCSCLARSQRRCWAGSSASTSSSCRLTWSMSTSYSLFWRLTLWCVSP